MGGVVSQYKDCVIKCLGKYHLWILLIIIYLVYAFTDIRVYRDDTWYSFLGIACMVLALWYLSTKVDWQKFKISSPITSLSNYSYGIYIFHNWLAMHMLSNTSKRILHLETIATNHEILFPIAFFLLTLSLSWLLTKALTMTRVGKFMIG